MKFGVGIKGNVERRDDKVFQFKRDDVCDEWRRENISIKLILKDISTWVS
jgi:hypothetical protein